MNRNELEAFRSQNHFPDREQFLDYSPEEAAQLLLRFFRDRQEAFVAGEAVKSISDRAYGGNEQVERVLMEGIAFLERYGLIVQEIRRYTPGTGRVLSRQGEQLARSTSDFVDFISRISDPQTLLHPEIRANALPLYERGPKYFETSVFQAFKSVEVAVREAAGLPDSLIGIKLMNQAFGPTGKLRDPNGESGEEEGVRNVFAGAIAAYKNPASHREVEQRDPKSVLRALLLASELMYIIDERHKAMNDGWETKTPGSGSTGD